MVTDFSIVFKGDLKELSSLVLALNILEKERKLVEIDESLRSFASSVELKKNEESKLNESLSLLRDEESKLRSTLFTLKNEELRLKDSISILKGE